MQNHKVDQTNLFTRLKSRTMMHQSLIWTDKTVVPQKCSFSTEIARICPLWVDFALDQGVRVVIGKKFTKNQNKNVR